MLRLAIPLLLLLGVLGLAVLWDPPAPKADFVFINRGDVTTLDLGIMSWSQDFRAARLLYEGLTRHDPFSAEFTVKPGVAESWVISPDGLTYTFRLRENAKWSNGEPVKASDFVYAWRRVLLPDTAGDYVKLMTLIRGGSAFYEWRTQAMGDFARNDGIADRPKAAEALWRETLAKFDELVGVKALDDRTLRVELERPVSYFLDLTAFGTFYPCYEPLVRAYESLDPQTGQMRVNPAWTKPPRLVTNGPFRLTVWRFQRDMRLERNEHYWDTASIDIDTISMPSVADTNAQVLAFRTGVVDWVSDVTADYRGVMLEQKQEFYAEHAEEVAALRAQGLDRIEVDRRLPPDPRKNIHAFPAFGTYFYNFNCLPRLRDGRPNPFADARVRRAFAMAVDKAAITQQVRRIGEPVADQLIPPGSLDGYRSPTGLAYNPEEARRLLAEAGYPEGRGFITVDILFNKDAGHDVIAQAVAKDWKRNLNVEVSLSQKEIKIVRDDLKNANYIVSRGSWFGDYGAPPTFLDLSVSGDGNNDRKYSNPAFDAIMDRASRAVTREEAYELWAQAEAMLVDEEVPILPLFFYVNLNLFDANRLTGVTPHPRQVQDLSLVDIFGDGKGTDEPKRMPPNSPGSEGSARGLKGGR